MTDNKLYTSLSANTIMAILTNHVQRTRLITSSTDKHYSLDSEDDFRSGCRNVSHQQQFFLELHSPGRSHYTPGFKPFTVKNTFLWRKWLGKKLEQSRRARLWNETHQWHTRLSPRVPLFCLTRYHILTPSVICYWTDVRQHGIYMLNISIQGLRFCEFHNLVDDFKLMRDVYSQQDQLFVTTYSTDSMLSFTKVVAINTTDTCCNTYSISLKKETRYLY